MRVSLLFLSCCLLLLVPAYGHDMGADRSLFSPLSSILSSLDSILKLPSLAGLVTQLIDAAEKEPDLRKIICDALDIFDKDKGDERRALKDDAFDSLDPKKHNETVVKEAKETLRKVLKILKEDGEIGDAKTLINIVNDALGDTSPSKPEEKDGASEKKGDAADSTKKSEKVDPGKDGSPPAKNETDKGTTPNISTVPDSSSAAPGTTKQ